MTDLANIRLFATHPHSCSYLEEKEATTVFVDPKQEVDAALYGALSDQGFRRSGAHLYRPHCNSCKACVPARVPAHLFKPNRNQRKCWNRNKDITVNSTRTRTDEQYALYERYINQRHSDGDMYPPSREQFDGFLTSEWGVTEYLEFRTSNKLIAVAVCDRLHNGYSAVYTYFAPEEQKRSLGVYAVLWQLELVKQLGLNNLYLGYWIKECQKMNYKTDYRPLELLTDNRWIRIS